MQKVCKICGIEKDISCFYKSPETRDRLQSLCKICKHEEQRVYREKTNNLCTKKYEKTHKGFIMRLYRNMKSRITGVQRQKIHLYEGKFLLPKNEFYEWAFSNPKFNILFDDYVKSGYQRRLSPSVDRIDSSKGYLIENMEFVTMSENSSRSSKKR